MSALRQAEGRPLGRRAALRSAQQPISILADYAGLREANAALARAREALRQTELQSVRIDALGAEIDRWTGGAP